VAAAIMSIQIDRDTHQTMVADRTHRWRGTEVAIATDESRGVGPSDR
jgi:hypothetical protein